MLKQVYLIDINKLYKETVVIDVDTNTYYDGEEWREITFSYVEVVPPSAKVIKWDGEKWVIVEEYPKQETTIQPSPKEKLNAQLLKQNAELREALGKQQAFNSQILLELAKLKQGGAV